MNHTKLCRTLFTAAFALLPFLAGIVYADDTDVYLTGTNVIVDERPNILIVFDNSGSMSSIVVGSGEKYNPATTYTGNFLDTKVYWSTSGVPPNNATGLSRSFDVGNNRCATSLPLLSSGGFYQGDYIGRWDASKKSWVDLAANVNPTYVDCKKDVTNSDTGTGGLGYPRNSSGGINGPYVATKSQSNINWNNLKRPTLYTANWLNWYYTPGSQDKSRLQIAKEVMKNIVTSTVNVNFGLMIFNRNTPTDSYNGGRVVSGIKEMTDTNKTSLINTIDSLSASTWTPLSEAMWEAYSYMAGKRVDYGDDDPTQTPGRDTSVEDGNGNYLSPFNYACQQSYIIYMTDGLPTKDKNADSKVQALVNDDGTPVVCSVDFPTINNDPEQGGLCLDDLAGYMYNNDLYAARNGIQRVVTYTIGFQVDTGILALTAQKGKGKYYTVDTAAGLAAAFQAAISEILSVNTSFAAPSLSVNAFNKLFNRNSVYFSLFKPQSTARWNGNIKNFGIKNCLKTEADVGNCTSTCTDADIAANKCVFGKIVDANKKLVIDPATSRIKETACSVWSDCTSKADGAEVTVGGSGSKAPARADRTIFTYTGATAPSNVALNVDAHKLVDSNAALTFDMLGLTHANTGDPVADAATDAAARTARINWIRGQDLMDEDNDTITTEDRWKFGDALHSRPLTVSYGGTEASPVIKIFVGSNDGGLRMINESTGIEEWAFIPPEMLAPLQGELETDAEGGTPPHPYGLDGTPTAWVYDKNDNGVIEPADGDFVRVFIGMRRGGSYIYALDVTPDDSCSLPSKVCPKYMWQIKGGVPGTDFAKLAQTWSAPTVTYIRYGITGPASVRKAVLIFGGGYYPAQDNGWGPDEIITPPENAGKGIGTGNAIFIVDPTDGSRLWWASAPGSGATLELANMNFSIPSDIAFIDANGDGETDRLYVGDMGGQLWRIDLGATLKKDVNGGSTGARLAVVTDGDPATKTDNRKFFYPPDVAQVTDTTFSTVKDYDMVTIGTGDREDPLNATVHNQLYAFRDNLISAKIANNFTPLTVSDLYDATANLIQDGDATQQAAALAALKAAKGWYIDLVEVASWKGEKALAPSVTLNGVVYYTTYLPADPNANNTCAPQEGTGRLYALNLLNAEAAMEQTGDNTLNKADRTVDLGGGIPSELVPVFQETGVTGLVGVGGGAVDYNPNIPLPRIKTFWHQ